MAKVLGRCKASGKQWYCQPVSVTFHTGALSITVNVIYCQVNRYRYDRFFLSYQEGDQITFFGRVSFLERIFIIVRNETTMGVA